MTVCYIGLGSNLDGPETQIKKALEALQDLPSTKLLSTSSLYGSKPLGPINQPDFINAVCSVDTSLTPLSLLEALRQIEHSQGRVRSVQRWGPRIIDMDILLYGKRRVELEDLVIPHREIPNRNFVLCPLIEITHDLYVPGMGLAKDMLASIGMDGLNQINSKTEIMENKVPEYIVVEGPIGVGKTSLAKRLAESFNIDLMLEMASENPFLPRFYKEPEVAALPTQLHFLFQRAKQIEGLRQADMFNPSQISDFLLQKDQLFARVTLNDDELDLYLQVYNRLTLEAPVPDLVIYLQAPVEVLMQRVNERGIDYELKITEDYLKRIADAYVEFFYHYDDSPLLILNTTDFDLVNGVHDYELLLQYINELPAGRHYFNPVAL